MRHYELADQRLARNTRPSDVARLYVHKSEWPDLLAMCASSEPCTIIGIEPVVRIPTFFVEALCQNPDAAFALAAAWYDYCQTSPHRPHGEEEALAWGRQFNAFPEIPRDWNF